MPEESNQIKVTRSHHTVLPEVETHISLRTHPKAVCYLYHDQFKHRRLQLDADDNGVIHFHTKAHKDWQPIEIHVEYAGENGVLSRHTLSLRGDTNHQAAVSPNEIDAPPVGTERPALEGNPLELSNRELITRGYPPRPDPIKFPARHARWRRNVSRPYTAVTPRLERHPDVSFSRLRTGQRVNAPTLPLPPPRSALAHASPTIPLPPPLLRSMFNGNSDNWSGAFLAQPINQFSHVQADWFVPGVFASPGAPSYSAAAVWIGFDDSGTDLFQSGTDSECVFFPWFNWVFTNYWIWIETLPFAPWGVPNFPVAPGDSISLDIFIADENGQTWYQNANWGGLTPQDNSVWFMLYNNTRYLSYWGTLPTAPQTLDGTSSTGFTGTTAEFILERPVYNGSEAALANFGLAVMQGCWYGDAQYGDQAFPLGQDGSSPFDGNLSYWNMQNAANGDLLDIAISAADPTSSGAEIIWIWTNYL
ncbi:MAG TPA: G1 family glutamic endopeptidase [Chthoniobacterales bacterium]